MRKSRKNISNNSGAMADVSFLLLIFFMVVTTFNKDYKIETTLPPYSENKTKGPINKAKVLQLLINGQNEIMLEEQVISQNLSIKIAEVLMQKFKAEIAPVVFINIHPNSDYYSYLDLLAQLNLAKSICRNQLSNLEFNSLYKELKISQKNEINTRLTMKISEQEISLL